MKILSVKQPYAQLIVSGIKDVENRTRKTNYRGRLYIHASKTIHDHYLKNIRKSDSGIFYNGNSLEAVDCGNVDNSFFDKCIFSAIIGHVELVDCTFHHESKFGIDGYYKWVLKNPVMYANPICNVNGKLGIWTADKNLYNKVENEIVFKNILLPCTK